MAAIKRLLNSYEFVVGLSGVPYAVGGVKGFEGDNAKENAATDAADRNARAAEMGVKARYEVYTV
jgi:hypothetical protein